MKLRTKLLSAAAGGLVLSAAALIGSDRVRSQGAVIQTALTGSEYFQNWNATVSQLISSASIAGYARSTALLYTTTAPSSDGSTTGEQTLASYTLPGGTLNVGTKLRIKVSFAGASNSNNKTFKLYFGASVITSGTLTTNNKNGSAEMIVTKIGAGPVYQLVYANMLVDTTPITGYVNQSGADNDASNVTIKFTGTNGTAVPGDVIINDFSVERLGN